MSSLQWYNDRAKELLYREIAWVISNKLRDPRISSVITITELNLAHDMRNATVFVSIYSNQNKHENVISALNGAAAFIQKTVSERISLKHFPKLCFKIDHSLDHSERINELFKKIKEDLD